MPAFPEFESLRTWPKASRADRLNELLRDVNTHSGHDALLLAISHVSGFGSNWLWLIDKLAKRASCDERVREACTTYLKP